MDRNFPRSLAACLAHEGGFVNHPQDPGGATNRGVTLENFRRYVKPDGTIADLKLLTAEQAGVVFRRQYWDVVMASDLPDGVDFAVFDFAVNSGPKRAAQFLQRIVGVDDDGTIGPKTLKAVGAMPKAEIINRLCDNRQKFLEGLDIFKTFGKGWTRRVKETRELALQMAAQDEEEKKIIVPPDMVPKAVETPVPVVPKGADKPGLARWMASVPLLGTAVTAFGNFDSTTKFLILGVVAVGVIALLWRGEQIAARAKKIVASFEE